MFQTLWTQNSTILLRVFGHTMSICRETPPFRPPVSHSMLAMQVSQLANSCSLCTRATSSHSNDRDIHLEVADTPKLDLRSHLLAARVGTCLWQFPQVAVSHTIFDLALKPNASGHWELAGCRSGHKMAVKPWYPSYPEIVGLWMFIHQTMASVGFDRQIFS